MGQVVGVVKCMLRGAVLAGKGTRLMGLKGLLVQL